MSIIEFDVEIKEKRTKCVEGMQKGQNPRTGTIKLRTDAGYLY